MAPCQERLLNPEIAGIGTKLGDKRWCASVSYQAPENQCRILYTDDAESIENRSASSVPIRVQG